MTPPPPPLPIPSKAAIRALRGLALGTTCSLALITEDRRRRINAAQSAIRNGNRIRSARQYNAGGSAFAIALEEDRLSTEPGVIHWESPAAQADGRRASTQHEPTATRTASTATTGGSQRSKTERSIGLVDWSEMTLPPPRRPSSPRRSSLSPREETTTRSHPLENASVATATAEATATPTPGPEPRVPPPASTSKPSPFSAIPPLRSASERVQGPLTSLARQAQEYKARAQLGRRVPSNIKPIGKIATTPVIDRPTAATEQIQDDLAQSRSSPDLEAAVTTLLSTAPIATGDTTHSAGQLPAFWHASAALCRECQMAGRMDLAQDVLQRAINCGQLDEAAYFAHNPLPVVQSLAPLDVLNATDFAVPITDADASARRDAFVRRLQYATDLFLPTLSSSSAKTQSATELIPVGKQLLECAFAARHHELIIAIYSSVAEYPNNISEFSQWYSLQLKETGDHRLLVSSFLARPPSTGSVSRSTFFEIGDLVVDATRMDHHQQAGAVLGALVASSSPTCRLRTSWVTDLLYGHWQKTQNYDEITSLFANLASHGEKGISSTVYHVNGAYRVMVQIALEADRLAEAKALFRELTALQPSAANDVRLLGLFALAKAKAGDWPGVQDDFQQAAAAAPKGLPARDAERVFVPIVKEYVRTHTIGETEDFLKMYIDEVGVPIGRYMVTLLANEYGALREMRSFIAWLEYCVQAGFAVDAAFSNAILQNCRKHWKFGFRDLRALYRKLRLLSPNFEDKVTQTIMTHAAISDAKNISRAGVKGRVLSLRIQTPSPDSSSYLSPLSASRHLLDENDLYVSMKQAFAFGLPGKVVRMYKHAMRGGMPPSAKCLKLAVAAAVKSGQLSSPSFSSSPKPTTDFDTAIDLLKTAHASGQDIDGATAYLAIAYIDALGPRSLSAKGSKASVATAVKSILLRLDACDVQMSDLALNRAAFHMFKAGHMSGAIALAMSAANSPVGGGRPGYNVWNFSVLISAYARLADAAGIRLAAEGAATSGILRELMGYKVLKQARRRLRTSQLENECAAAVHGRASTTTQSAWKAHAQDIQHALQAVEDVLDQARAARQQLGAERRELETATIDIMRQAALDAGHEPVDFDKDPSLRRQRRRQQQQSATAATITTSGEEDGSSSVTSGSSWDLLDMPVDQEGRLIHSEAQKAAPLAAVSA